MESSWRNFPGSKEEVLKLRREQNRESSRRSRKKKAQQRAFLEEEMQRVRTQIAGSEDDSVLEQLKKRLQNLEGIAAVHNRSSQSKVEYCASLSET